MTSGVAAILVALNPILATGLSRILLPDERLAPVGIVGLLLGFLGGGLVARPSPSNLLASDIVAQGFVLLAALCVALGSVLVQRIDDGMSAEGTVAWSNTLGAVILHALSFGMPSKSVTQADLTTESVVAVVDLAVLASAVGYFIYFDLLDRLGAIEINLVSYAAPIFAALSGWLVLGETLELLSVVGFLVILTGFVLLKWKSLRLQADLLNR